MFEHRITKQKKNSVFGFVFLCYTLSDEYLTSGCYFLTTCKAVAVQVTVAPFSSFCGNGFSRIIARLDVTPFYSECGRPELPLPQISDANVHWKGGHEARRGTSSISGRPILRNVPGQQTIAFSFCPYFAGSLQEIPESRRIVRKLRGYYGSESRRRFSGSVS